MPCLPPGPRAAARALALPRLTSRANIRALRPRRMDDLPPPASNRPRRVATALSVAVVAAAFLHALLPSWRRWGSLYLDVGRELELPRQLLEGAWLYDDVRAYYGPLAYWVNEALYALFGVHADVLAGAGLVTAALFAAGVWLLTRELVGGLAAPAVVAAAVVELCFFSQLVPNPSFNFVLPYSFGATYGVLLLLASVLLLVRHARTGSPRDFALAAAALALVALTKMELLAAALAAHATFALAMGRGRLGRLHAVGWSAALLAPATVYAALWARVGARLWDDSLGAMFHPAAASFFRTQSGLDDAAGSLAGVGRSLLAFGLTAALAWGVGRVARRPSLPRWSVALLSAVALAGCAAGWARMPWLDALRALPFVLGGALIATLAVAWRRPGLRPGLAPDLIVLVAALALLGRLGLAVRPSNYGFYLLPLGLVALGLVAFGRFPALLAPPGAGRGAAAAAAAGLLLGVAWQVVGISRAYLAFHTATLATSRGTFVVRPGEELTLVPLLARLPPGTPMVVLPSGAGYAYAAGQPWADGTHSYFPMDLAGGYTDEATVLRWRARPPEVVVWLDSRARHAREFGARALGEDHGVAIRRFLEARYVTLHPPTLTERYTVMRLRHQPRAAPAASSP